MREIVLFPRRTSENWSRFLDRYPDRFKINYPLADESNDLYIPSRPGRYPVSFFFFLFIVLRLAHVLPFSIEPHKIH